MRLLRARLLRWLIGCWLLASGAVCGEEPSGQVAPHFQFEPPVRLQGDGTYIDTGKQHGHCGPTVVDLDGDGLQDLVVGDFSGKFHLYRNVGTATAPVYESQGRIQAGGVDAEVLIYCCIGSQPRFCDLMIRLL